MALHEETSEKSMTLAARVGQITAEELKKAVSKLMAELSGGKMNPQGKSGELKHGRQTLNELAKHNAGMSSVELSDPNLRLLNRTMKQNGVDFAPVRDGKGKYTLFFKGRDADALTRAFSQYTRKVTERAAKPSIGATLAAMKQAAGALNDGRDKVKNLDKGERDI
jgi:hypothetical protein